MRTMLAALTVVAAAVHTAAKAPRPQTLFQAPPHQPISAFAQDGSRIAWFTPSSSGCNTIDVLQLGSVFDTLPAQSADNVTCRWDVVPPVRLALAGTNGRVLWTLREAAPPAPLAFDYVLGASVADRKERRFLEIAHASRGAGLWLGGIAGDGDTLVYAVTQVDYADEVSCLSNPSLPNACALKISPGGGIHRIVGRTDLLIPQTSAAIEVAVSGETVAYVPAAAIDKNGQPLPGSQPIEIRGVADGHTIGAVTPEGTPLAIALSPTLLAALESTPGGLRIAWYRVGTGEAVGSVAVPSGTSPELSESGKLILFRVGRSIRTVDVTTQRLSTVASAAAPPIGLSLEGSRIAWAENVAGRGRIRALSVTP